jgi:hypothetical protein
VDYEAWQMKRKELMDREKQERSINWQQSRAPIQAAITEQAVRELYDKVEALEEAMLSTPLESKPKGK